MYGDAGALVRCQYVTTVTAAEEAAHCVHALMVTRVAVRMLALIYVQTVRRFVVTMSVPVEAIAGVTRADDPSKVISALLLTGRRFTHIHTFRYALAHHKPEAVTAFPPEAGAVLAPSSHTGILHSQDLIVWTLLFRSVHRERRPDRAGTRFPQKNNTNCTKW